MFISVLLAISRTWKQLKHPPTEDLIKKLWHIYTLEYYSAIKKKEGAPLAAT